MGEAVQSRTQENISLLSIIDVSVAFGDLRILDHISFSVPPGEWLMITGPNGAGKSTIVNAIMRQVTYTGEIRASGENVRHMHARKLAHSFGVLSQNHSVGYAFTVEEVVRLGRYSRTRGIFSADKSGEADIDAAIEITGLQPLLKQSVLTLSGGELQRTFLAQLFAQNPSVLILDEPTNHLDLVYQKQIFALISKWLSMPGRAVVSVVHDLSLALKYGTRAILMNSGHIVSEGVPSEALSREALKNVYGMDVHEWMRDMLSQWE